MEGQSDGETVSDQAIVVIASYEEEQYMDLQLSGRLALVTGSTVGIGLAIGSGLTGEGATVVINGRSKERVTKAIGKIRQKHPHAKLEPLIADLSTVEAAKQAVSTFPHVDILINNLGSYEPKPFEAISDQDWQTIIDERCALEPALLTQNDDEKLGENHFHLERIRRRINLIRFSMVFGL
jgi:short subunit dehydrogenase